MLLLLSAAWPDRALIKAQLETSGYDVVGVDSFDDAARWLRSRVPVDLLILDTRELDPDPDFLRRLAELHRPVLLLTGIFDAPAWDLPALGVRLVGILVRPFFIGDVVEAVRKGLG
jgi:DNA-binding response OmpR family regulator